MKIIGQSLDLGYFIVISNVIFFSIWSWCKDFVSMWNINKILFLFIVYSIPISIIQLMYNWIIYL
jgi:hypothetical protein